MPDQLQTDTNVDHPTSVDEDARLPEEYVIETIVDHEVNRSRRNRYAKYGDTLYKVRWHGYQPDDDTWEPTKHLPRSHISRYYARRKEPVPPDIDDAMVG